jgi:DNA-binding response OmpR family regulator
LKIGEAPDVIGRVLWVDDHPGNNAEERRFLEGRRIAVYEVTSSDDAMKLLSMYKYDAVISDMGRNGNPLAGLELVREMRAQKNYTPFVLYTILPSKAQRDLLAEYGGQGVAVTPEGLYSFLLPGLDRRSAQRAAD